MERIRVKMLESVDALFAGECLNLPEAVAQQLIASGKAKSLEMKPSEKKVVEPAETKTDEAESAGTTPKVSTSADDQVSTKPLNKMNVVELTAVAEAAGVTLQPNATKKQIIAAIEEAQK